MGFLTETEASQVPESFSTLKRNFGLVPKVFRAQLHRADLVDSQVQLLNQLLFKEGALSRIQKEFILLSVSAENNNQYFPALHSQTLLFLGIKADQSQRVITDHREANLSQADIGLLDFARRLTSVPRSFSQLDVELLRKLNFSDAQILEAVLMVGLTQLLNCVQMGLGVEPDFKPRVTFPLKEVNLSADTERQMLERPLTDGSVIEDPDVEIVRRVKGGETDAFEELVRRHGRRVYRSLIGILGDPDDAEDALQDCFLKAFQHLPEFEGRARFSTWLVRIAINTGVQRLRGRKDFDTLDDEGDDFKPKRIQAWEENPEDSYSREELRQLVEKEVMKLPAKYRVALILRDLEELSTVQAANVLGLTVPGLKARVLRGRLMLRESMVTYFAKTNVGVKV